ncbi:heme o synthase [Pseudoalteromonas sp.]|uniref:heme o synthase n=1 Tax=Pseudoalteromonas sp. TaxID=53249 RepID=UPI00356833B6
MTSNVLQLQRSVSAKIHEYLVLCKHKVVMLLALTAVVGQGLAPASGRSLLEQTLTILGIALLASSAAVINHIVDSDIDKKMRRTDSRPVATGSISNTHAFTFSMILLVIGFCILVQFANWLTAWLTMFALVGYAFIYTLVLKRRTPQNIVIGGFAGAMPPLLGWVSETGAMSAEPWLLVMIVFAWTPPHFWALAIDRKKDYENAKIPMLPVTHGIEFTKTMVLLYSVLLTLVCVLPFLIGMSGNIYLIASLVLNSIFVYRAWQLKFVPKEKLAIKLFIYSIWQLMLLFIALFVDKWLI